MELVYLYIEKYKNIEKQGFNFSPKFRCEYNPENKNLTIEKKDNNLENFFGNNINITAIVGENGSGKSSILEAILKVIEQDETEQIKVILVFKKINNEIKYTSTIIELDIKTDIEKGTLPDNTVFADYDFIDNNLSCYFINYGTFALDKSLIVNLILAEYGRHNKIDFLELSTFMYIPTKIEIKLKDLNLMLEENISFIASDKERKLAKQIYKSISDSYHQFLFICYIRSNKTFNSDILDNKDKLLEECKENKGYINNNIYWKYFISFTVEKIFNIQDLTDEQKNIWITKNGFPHFFDFDLIDKKDRRYNNLSQGEKHLFAILLNLHFLGGNPNPIFLLDEPDNSLHPNWQKALINEIYLLFKNRKTNIHLILTSHSPFILSDLPKENVIFLEQYKQDDDEVQNSSQQVGNCKNVTNSKELQTFGQNIHTLLSDSFFMKDGLMGDFAKSKIEKIKKCYDKVKPLKKDDDKTSFIQKYKNKKINFKQTQKIIGEPYLKVAVQNWLDEIEIILYGKDKALDNKIKELQELQKELENAKS